MVSDLDEVNIPTPSVSNAVAVVGEVTDIETASCMTAQTFHSNHPDETRRIGENVGRALTAGDVVALIGDLGTGKTCLTQGIARGIGLHADRLVSSPSYTLINEYEGLIPIYHIDLYRLDKRDHVWELGLDEYLEGDGVCVIEWADVILDQLPKHTIQIKLCWIDESSRAIEVNGRGSVSTHTLSLTKELREPEQA